MRQEHFGYRSLAYSNWHRAGSLARYLPIDQAQRLAMIDLDAAVYVEYEASTRAPLILIETARDVGQRWKSATVVMELARRANVPAYALLYQLAETTNPADSRFADCAGFRIRRLYPKPERNWRTLSPAAWASALVRIRSWSIKRLGTVAANDDRFETRP